MEAFGGTDLGARFLTKYFHSNLHLWLKRTQLNDVASGYAWHLVFRLNVHDTLLCV